MQKVLAKQQERSKRSDSNHQVVNQVAEKLLKQPRVKESNNIKIKSRPCRDDE